jgi:hypothetical protein
LGMTELVTSTNVSIVPASTTTHVTEPVHDLWRLCGYGTLFYCCTRRFYGRKKGPSAVNIWSNWCCQITPILREPRPTRFGLRTSSRQIKHTATPEYGGPENPGSMITHQSRRPSLDTQTLGNNGVIRAGTQQPLTRRGAAQKAPPLFAFPVNP